MPSINHGKNCKTKPWRARIRRYGQDFYLGYYSTYEEAYLVEQHARERWPSQKGKRVLTYG